jgi:hypothetical protein
MADCLALRCGNPAIHDLVIPGGQRRESAVCADHHALIEAGGEWRLEVDQNVLLVGEDLKDLGEYVVESWQLLRDGRWPGIDSAYPNGFLTLEMTLRRRGGTDTEDRTLLLSSNDAAKWAFILRHASGPDTWPGPAAQKAE